MHLEIPECKRCCCFVPLRYGIIVFGYLGLLLSLLILSLEIWVTVGNEYSNHTMMMYRGVAFYAQMWFTVLLYMLEVIFNVVLLIGAHLKKTHLLRAYYYYGITTTLASLVTFLVVKHHQIYSDLFTSIFELSFVFCGFVFQIYLLLLIRTELKKLRQNHQLSFVNHIAEVVVDAPRGGEGRNPL